jgi:hypothetical protein
VGYSYETEKILVVNGEVVRVPIIEHVPPDTTAVWNIMKGLDPDSRRERTEHSFARLVGREVPNIREGRAILGR